MLVKTGVRLFLQKGAIKIHYQKVQVFERRILPFLVSVNRQELVFLRLGKNEEGSLA